MWLDVSPFGVKSRPLMLCTSSFQADGISNGTHSKKALLSDSQLFEAKFDELVTELIERDLKDPGLVDALNRHREVRSADLFLWHGSSVKYNN